MIDSTKFENVCIEMPELQLYSLENVAAIINLNLVLTKVNEQSYDRGMIFVTVITFIYSINFIYLTAKVLFFGDPLEDVGSIYFIANSFYSCTILCIYILWIIAYGSEANNIDILLKEKFH